MCFNYCKEFSPVIWRTIIQNIKLLVEFNNQLSQPSVFQTAWICWFKIPCMVCDYVMNCIIIILSHVLYNTPLTCITPEYLNFFPLNNYGSCLIMWCWVCSSREIPERQSDRENDRGSWSWCKWQYRIPLFIRMGGQISGTRPPKSVWSVYSEAE